MERLVESIALRGYDDEYCLAQASEAGAWVARVGMVSFGVCVTAVVLLILHRSAIGAMFQGVAGGARAELVPRGRGIIIASTAGILCAIVAVVIAYLHMQGVIEDCV
jgi:hypothetical protein